MFLPLRRMDPPAPDSALEVIELGRMAYDDAYALQTRHQGEVIAWRSDSLRGVDARVGRLLLVEHDPPVITISRRAGARDHLLVPDEVLAREGIQVRDTDRGGDITYHGPGQLVAYPIIDLNRCGLNLHSYMRLLEAVVIATCSQFGVRAERDPSATGVWVGGAKIAALGVRVRRWVTMHGLALNVSTNLDHFGYIIPCGLAGREVTSMARVLGEPPPMDAVKSALVRELRRALPYPCTDASRVSVVSTGPAATRA